MNKDYKSLIKEKKKHAEPNVDEYEICVECDASDGDCIDDMFTVYDLLENELFFLVLCYINTYEAFGHTKREDCFGHHVEDDMFLDWLYDYCTDNDLLLFAFAGMCDCRCHSITSLEITHLFKGSEYEITLPSINEIFDTPEEMIDYMTNLYNN